MPLRVSQVSRCLDKKLMLFGFEVFDLLALLISISVLNFVFGQTALKPWLVWLPNLVLALLLRFGKRGKPDKHTFHWIRFQGRPGVLSAFIDPESVELTLPHTRRQTR